MDNEIIDPIFDVLIPNLFTEAGNVSQKSSVEDAAWEPFQPWKCKCGQSYIVLSKEKLSELSSGNDEKLAVDLKTDFYIYQKEPLNCRRCNLVLRVMHEEDFTAANARHSANRKADMATPTSEELKIIAQEQEVRKIMNLNLERITLASISGDREVHAEVVDEKGVTRFVTFETTRYQAYKAYFEQAGLQIDESLSMVLPMVKPNQ